MTTTIRKIQNAATGYGDRSAKIRTSAVYGVFDDGQQVGRIEREAQPSYMQTPFWRVTVHGFTAYIRLLTGAKDKAKEMVDRYNRGELVSVEHAKQRGLIRSQRREAGAYGPAF